MSDFEDKDVINSILFDNNENYIPFELNNENNSVNEIDNQNIDNKLNNCNNKIIKSNEINNKKIYDKHKNDRKSKNLRNLLKKQTINHNEVYDINLSIKSNIAIGIYQSIDNTIKIIKQHGNFWKTFGFTKDSICYLYLEEGLYLFERSLLLILNESNQRIALKDMYNIVLDSIGLHCYLAYSKLKMLEYIVVRYSNNSVKCINNNQELICNDKLLEGVISYNVYLKTPGISKKKISQSTPLSYVIITNLERLFRSDITLQLIDQSTNIPLLLVVITSTFGVLIQELSDAQTSLDLNNNLSMPIDIYTPFDINYQINEYHLTNIPIKPQINPKRIKIDNDKVNNNDNKDLQNIIDDNNSDDSINNNINDNN